jgi:hypothetical protein
MKTVEDIEMTEHDFEWVIDQPAEVGKPGVKHQECKTCGYKKEAVEIPALSNPEYPPIIIKTEGGQVQVDNQKPNTGDKVTVIVTSEEGYKLKDVMITDQNGVEVRMTEEGNGSYSFIQPEGAVTIKVDFEKLPNASETTNSPQTGDDRYMGLWITIMLVAIAGMVGTLVYDRKKNSHQ